MLERIGDLPKQQNNGWEKENEKVCMHPEHNPPKHVFLQPGVYRHTCPSCGKRIVFTVPLITC